MRRCETINLPECSRDRGQPNKKKVGTR